MVLESGLRLVASTAVAMVFGMLYYNAELNPLARIWRAAAKPHIQNDDIQMMNALVGTALAKFALAIFILRYVHDRVYSLWGLLRMSMDLTLMSALLQLTHWLWLGYDLKILGIDTLYDLIVCAILAVGVGYKREPKVVVYKSPYKYN